MCQKVSERSAVFHPDLKVVLDFLYQGMIYILEKKLEVASEYHFPRLGRLLAKIMTKTKEELPGLAAFQLQDL